MFWRKGSAGLSTLHFRHILYEFAALVPGLIYVVAFEARRMNPISQASLMPHIGDRWTNVDRLVAYLSGTTNTFRPPTYAEFCLYGFRHSVNSSNAPQGANQHGCRRSASHSYLSCVESPVTRLPGLPSAVTRMEHYLFIRCKLHEWKLVKYDKYESTMSTSMLSTSRASASQSQSGL